MSVSSIDVCIIIVYLLFSIGLGSWFVRRSRDPDSFTRAKGRIPAPVVGLSLFGTYISSISFLGYAGNAFATNWNVFVLSLSLFLSVWISTKWFVPFYRASGEVSTYCHLESRFGIWARVYCTVCYMFTQVARMGTVMFLLALPLHHFIGLSISSIIICVGIATSIYTILGGIEGVVWTDALQSGILILGAITCAVLIPLRMPEGPAQVFSVAMEHHKFSLGTFAPTFTESSFWLVLFYGMINNLQNFGIDQSFVQRYLTANSNQAARRSLWLSTAVTIPMNACFFFIGTALFALYTVSPELFSADLVEQLRQGKGADSVFPYYIVHGLPVGVTGLLVAAVIAAAMSTVSSSLNGCATLSLTDFYKRFFRPNATSREQMIFLYCISAFWGIAGIGSGLVISRAQNILDAWLTIQGIAGGGMLGLFLLGFMSKKTTNFSAVIGTLFGIAVIIWMTLSLPGTGLITGRFRSPFHAYMIPVFGTLAIILAGFLVTFLFRRKRD